MRISLFVVCLIFVAPAFAQHAGGPRSLTRAPTVSSAHSGPRFSEGQRSVEAPPNHQSGFEQMVRAPTPNPTIRNGSNIGRPSAPTGIGRRNGFIGGKFD